MLLTIHAHNDVCKIDEMHFAINILNVWQKLHLNANYFYKQVCYSPEWQRDHKFVPDKCNNLTTLGKQKRTLDIATGSIVACSIITANITDTVCQWTATN